jgi:hypothetical protein
LLRQSPWREGRLPRGTSSHMLDYLVLNVRCANRERSRVIPLAADAGDDAVRAS